MCRSGGEALPTMTHIIISPPHVSLWGEALPTMAHIIISPPHVSLWGKRFPLWHIS